MIILALIALIVIPPDKLPEFARQMARLFRDLRRSTAGVWDDLKHEAMLKPEDLMKYKPNYPDTSQAPAPGPHVPDTLPVETPHVAYIDPAISANVTDPEKKSNE